MNNVLDTKNTYDNGWGIFLFLVILECRPLKNLVFRDAIWGFKWCFKTELSADHESFCIEIFLLVSV